MDFPVTNTKYDHVNNFVNTLAPIVCNEWVKRREAGQKTISPAVVIAQGGKESGWNLNAATLFGIKGNDVTLDTTEYINGEYVNIQDGFASYPDIAGAVQGYYDLMQWDNYDDATSADTVEGELEGLTNDIGLAYATAPDYYQTTLDIINDFNLRVYNDYVWDYVNGGSQPEEAPVESEESEAPTSAIDEDVVDAIYRGEYGNGEERRARLTEAGYDYDAYQARVEEKYYSDSQEEEESSAPALEEGMDVLFTGSTDVNGNSLAYTNRTYQINSFSDDREKVLLDIYGEHYAWVWTSEVTPA